MNTKTTYDSSPNKSLDNAVNTLRSHLHQKLDELPNEQLNLLWQFVAFLEYQQAPYQAESSMTNEEIDKIVESYRQQNKLLPIGLAQGEFIVPDDFNDPLPDEILDLFEAK
jgi:hypothetical protein